MWTDNPALCIADYLYDPNYGLGAGAISGGVYTEIDDTVLTASANECEEAVDILPSGTEERYTLNGAFDVDAPHEDILQRMLTAMAGTLVYAEGKWHVHAGAHTASVQTITEDDIIAPVKVTPRLSRSELFNRVKGIYVNPANKYLPSDYPAIASTTYATEDGETLTIDHDLPFTASASTAQRLAKIELETWRQQIMVNDTEAAERLPVVIRELLADPEALLRMSSRAGALGRPDSGDRLARSILGLAGGGDDR